MLEMWISGKHVQFHRKTGWIESKPAVNSLCLPFLPWRIFRGKVRLWHLSAHTLGVHSLLMPLFWNGLRKLLRLLSQKWFFGVMELKGKRIIYLARQYKEVFFIRWTKKSGLAVTITAPTQTMLHALNNILLFVQRTKKRLVLQITG